MKNDGSVWSCGYNDQGQLGLNDTTNRTTFTQVTTNINNDVKQISCGYHTFILKNDGSVWGCGYNNYGQLGLGSTTQKNTFNIIPNMSNTISEYEIQRLKLYYYLLDNSVNVTESMDIGTMLDLLVDDYINKLILGYENNLRIILTDEGVSVSDEDNMDSLIAKVDEEFDRQVVPQGTAVAANVDSGKTFINSTGQLVTGTSNKISPAGNAVASNVLSGKTFINSTGKTVTGTMTNRGGAQTITPGTSDKTLNSGYYSGDITVKGDSNLKAGNIKSGVSIFGVSGTLSSSLSSTTISTSQVSYKTGYVLVTHNLYVNMSVLFCQVGTYMQNPGTGVIYVSQHTGNAIISNLLNISESTRFSASFYNDYYSAGDVCTVGLWISDITSTSFRINYKYEYDVSGEETDGLTINIDKIWYM